MTTFPERITYVHLAIKSLLNQTVKPYKIILWLARDQFKDVCIPDQLRELCKYGLDIRYCDENILAHKKYYYSMLEFPEKVIITYDDDIIYPEDSIEKLLRIHAKQPNAIICNRGREIEFENDGFSSYKKWKISGKIPAGISSYRVMASTGAGALYPPNCMPKETFNIESIKKLALTADDLWIKVMSIKGRIPVVKSQTRCKALCLSVEKQGEKLADYNVTQNQNDHIIKNLVKQYPEVLHIVMEDVVK